jgi:hypothetical protein
MRRNVVCPETHLDRGARARCPILPKTRHPPLSWNMQKTAAVSTNGLPCADPAFVMVVLTFKGIGLTFHNIPNTV